MPQQSRMPRIDVRQLIVFAIVSITTGTLGFILREDLYRFFYFEPRLILLTNGILAITGVIVFLFLYLRGELLIPAIERITNSEQSSTGTIEIEAALKTLEDKLNTTQRENRTQLAEFNARLTSLSPTSAAGSVDMAALLDAVREHVNATLGSEIEARVANRLLKDVVWRDTRQVFEAASIRLREEITSLTRRANVNLLIGVATTIMAVSLLVYMVLTATTAFTAWPELLSHYIPRISTVIFIEIFSFFFLRLYRASLAEIKGYQNELTALDSSRIALSSSQAASDPKALTTVIIELARVHRCAAKSSAAASTKGGQLKEMAEMVERLAKIASSAVSKNKAAKDSDG